MPALWLALPVVLGGGVHILVIKRNWFPSLAKIPLDLGLFFRGERLFGEHKTLRGAVTMVAATSLFAMLQSAIQSSYSWADRLSVVPFARESPGLWGVILGSGYIIGELPNSFLKRRCGLRPGGSGTERSRSFFWLLDQLDSYFGVIALMCLVWRPQWEIVLQLGILTLLIHPSITFVSNRGSLRRAAGVPKEDHVCGSETTEPG